MPERFKKTFHLALTRFLKLYEFEIKLIVGACRSKAIIDNKIANKNLKK